MDHRIADNIHRINFLAAEMDGLYHNAAQRLGVSDSVMCILYAIQDNGENCLLSDVYKQSGVSKQTINSAVRKMEQEELLYLVADDGRRKRIFLTEKGRKYMAESAGCLFEMEKRAFGSWPQEKLEEYITLMESYVEALRREVGKL